MKPWKTLARETILDCGKFLTVENHKLELPNGQVINQWPWLVTPDYINVVVITEDDRFLCFRQTKYAVEGTFLALVGGYIDAGESPLAAAQRELLEETGYQARDWMSLGSYRVDGNRGAGMAHLFLATGAQRVTEPDVDDLEEQQLLYLSRSEVETALIGSEFKVLPNSTAVALALLYIGE